MPETTEMWYLRFPDGRVLRAVGTNVVRQQLAAGRLPVGTRMRRSLDDEWRSIDRFPELADLAPMPVENGGPARPARTDWRDAVSRAAPVTITSRLDPMLLRLPGVRSLVEESLGALDSTMVRSKLLVAALAGLVLGALAALAGLPAFDFGVLPPGLGWLLPVAALLIWSWLAVMLSRMAYVELSRLRPARWRDGLAGCAARTFRLAVAQGLLVVLLAGLIAGLRWLPGWLLTAGNDSTEQAFQAVAGFVVVVGLVLELVLWPALLLLLPLGAVVVVEDASILSALGQWCRLVRQRAGRLLLAEALAVGVGLVIVAPLALLAAALLTRLSAPEFAATAAITQNVLCGLIASVGLAYLVVANVFIYLNLRYER
jgi:hypothetical protein